MKITVQITVESAPGQPEVIQQVARLERAALRPDTLGLILAEARSILTGLEQTMVERQTAELVVQEQRCCHLHLNRRLARERSPRSLHLNARIFCSQIGLLAAFGEAGVRIDHFRRRERLFRLVTGARLSPPFWRITKSGQEPHIVDFCT